MWNVCLGTVITSDWGVRGRSGVRVRSVLSSLTLSNCVMMMSHWGYWHLVTLGHHQTGPVSVTLSALRHSGKWTGDVFTRWGTNRSYKAHVACCWVLGCHAELIKSSKGFLFASGVGIKQWLSPLPVTRSSCQSGPDTGSVITQLSHPTFLSLIHQNWLIGTYPTRNGEKINTSSHHQWFYNYPHHRKTHFDDHAARWEYEEMRRYEQLLTIDIWPGFR